MPLPALAKHVVYELRHAIQRAFHFRSDVRAVNVDGSAAGVPQGDVQRRALFSDVDVVATKHGFDLLRYTAFPGQCHQLRQGVIGHAVAGVIQRQAAAANEKTAGSGRLVSGTEPWDIVESFLSVNVGSAGDRQVVDQSCGTQKRCHQ